MGTYRGGGGTLFHDPPSRRKEIEDANSLTQKRAQRRTILEIACLTYCLPYHIYGAHDLLCNVIRYYLTFRVILSSTPKVRRRYYHQTEFPNRR